MEKKTLREIMEELNQEEGRQRYEKYVFAEEASEKQLKNAIDAYARDVKAEEIVAILDTTFRGNGKDGFLFTENHMYGKGLKNGPIDLEQLKYAAVVKEGDFSQNVFIYKDGTNHRLSVSENRKLEKVMPLLRKMTGCEKTERRPEGNKEEFDQDYHRVIRRQIEEIVERHSRNRKNGQLSFPQSMDSPILNKLIRKAGADVSLEEIIAVCNAGAENGNEGAIFTSYAYYPCYYDVKNVTPVYYDGLERVLSSASLLGNLMLVYENGYVQSIPNGPEAMEDQEILRDIIDVFSKIKKQPAVRVYESLSSIKGWKEFVDRRKKDGLEAYRNSIFVSSTFKDMHYERDTIHEKVLPLLNEIGRNYGQTISFCDLRWGVNTGELDSEEGAKKVLSVCMNEIERCKPYMIVILGERYGWIPEENIIANALEGQPDFTLDELEKSVTALEIEFGALAHTDQIDRTFFYFREMEGNPSDIYRSEDAYHAKKLKGLKERICKLAGKQVKSYTVSWKEEQECPEGMDAFAQMVIKDVKEAMEGEWQRQAAKTVYEKEQEMHWELAEKKALQCAARDGLVLSYLKQMEQGEKMLVITGESGSGKSTLLGCLAVTLRLSGAQVLPIFCGYTAKSDTGIEVVQNMVHFLSVCLGLEEEEELKRAGRSEGDWLKRMNFLTEKYTQEGERQIVFVIDAVDQLLAGELRDTLKFIPSRLTDKVRVVLSCLSDFPLPYVPNKQRLPLIKKEDRQDVIQGILRLHRRELENPVIAAIAAKPFSDHPLYMSLLIQRLLMMNKNDFDDIAEQGDGISAITRHQLKLVEESADDLSGICRKILQEAAERIGGKFVEKAMEYLAVSRHGLRERDLEGLLREDGILWNTLDFSLFIHYLRSMFLVREDGRIDFSHKSFREGIQETLEQGENLHEKIWIWMNSLPENDEIRQQERLYHEILADKKSEFIHDIQRKQKDEAFMKTAAKELALYSRADGGRWIEESLKGEAVSEADQSYIHFLLYPLHWEMSDSGEEGILKEKIFLALLAVVRRIAETEQTEANLRNVSIAYHRLGAVYKWRETEKNYEKALAYFQDAITISRNLASSYGTDESKRDLAIDCYSLGDLYLKISEEGNRGQAMKYYQESIQWAEEAAAEHPALKNRTALGWAYKKMADLCETDGENEKALEYLKKCMGVRERIVKEEPDASHRKGLCYVYDAAAVIYMACNDEEHLQEALHLFQKEVALWEEIVQNERSANNLYWLGDGYANSGHCCFMLREKANKEEALKYYDKAIPVLEEICRAGMEEARWGLAVSCERAAGLSHELAGASNLVNAKVRAQKAVGLYEELAKEKDTENSYMDWARMLLLYHEYFPRTETGFRSLEQYTEIMELLYKRTKNRIYKTNINRIKAVIKLEGAICK